MSADNWTECPKCEARIKATISERRRIADDAYGKVPAEQWVELKTEAERVPVVVKHSFREDYEIGLRNGQFSVEYRGHCDDCGLSVSHSHTQEVAVNDA